MKVVQPSNNVQNIVFRPRTSETTVILSIREKGIDIWANYAHEGVRSNGFLTLGVEHPFEEGKQYQFLLYGTNNAIIWRGVAYCTAQAPETYKLHPELISETIPQAVIPGGTPTSTATLPEGAAAIADLQSRMTIVETELIEHLEQLP
ncbi:MAG: hypothetical protein AAGF96_05910 [Bacteroidota bacterium]